MDLDRALEIVTDLANENTLSESLAESEGLEETREEQEEAVELVCTLRGLLLDLGIRSIEDLP